MSNKVKPWHQRKPKHQDKNRRPNHKKKGDYCPPVDGEDLDEKGSMLGGNWEDDEPWES